MTQHSKVSLAYCGWRNVSGVCVFEHICTRHAAKNTLMSAIKLNSPVWTAIGRERISWNSKTNDKASVFEQTQYSFQNGQREGGGVGQTWKGRSDLPWMSVGRPELSKDCVQTKPTKKGKEWSRKKCVRRWWRKSVQLHFHNSFVCFPVLTDVCWTAKSRQSLHNTSAVALY